MLTLKDLVDNISVDSAIIEIHVWNDDTNEYDFLFHFEDCDDLGAKQELRNSKYFCAPYHVRWIGAEKYDYDIGIRIEIENFDESEDE